MYLHKDALGWSCRVQHKGKRTYQGGFKSKKEATEWGRKEELKKLGKSRKKK